MSKIGSLDPEILAKKWSKSGQIEVSQRFFEKISRNMTDTEKMLISIVVGIGSDCAYLKFFLLKSVQWFRSYGQNSNGLERYSAFHEGSFFFEKISRNMTDTEKIMLTDIIGNFVADNIVFEGSKIGPVDPEIWAKKGVKITETRIS